MVWQNKWDGKGGKEKEDKRGQDEKRDGFTGAIFGVFGEEMWILHLCRFRCKMRQWNVPDANGKWGHQNIQVMNSIFWFFFYLFIYLFIFFFFFF